MVNKFWKKLVNSDGNRQSVKVNKTVENPNGIVDGLLWYKDLGLHSNGEFSMAVIQATGFLEDQSQLESGALSSHVSGPYGTFIGVYDGHGGPDASRFVCHTLFSKLKKFAFMDNKISETVIKAAFLETESEFLSFVRQQWLLSPQMALVGTCCLVGIICNGLLYIANAGDSRVVSGRGNKTGKGVTAIQLSEEHNANIESVRNELRRLNPNDPQIVVQKHEVWRVKGIIQVTRSIGDAYLKNSEFNREPLLPKFRVSQPFSAPILNPEPSILVQKLNQNDQFLIFASDGLWEHLSNQEAVEIVKKNPRHGIARKLVEAALCVAAKKREILYSDLKDIGPGIRRYFHDDISVVVVFLDQASSASSCPRVSVRGGGSLNGCC